MKVEVNYESRTGKIHSGGIYAQWIGITKCGLEFSTSPKNMERWVVTNQPVTCKSCRKILDKKRKFEKGGMATAAVGPNIHIFAIDTKEKAKFATIGSRIHSLLETWNKMFLGKISKKDFYSDIRWDMGGIEDDLEDYTHLDGDKEI
jgi:hypothetical protein